MSYHFEQLVIAMREEAGIDVREGSFHRQPESTIAWPMREDTPEEYMFWPTSDEYFAPNEPCSECRSYGCDGRHCYFK